MKKRTYIRALILTVILVLLTAVPGTGAVYYWEEPLQVSRGNGAFPQMVLAGAGTKARVVTVWQAYETTTTGGTVWLSAMIYSENETTRLERFAGPYSYSGTSVPVLFSMQSNASGEVGIVVSSTTDTLQFFLLDAARPGFSLVSEFPLSEPAVLPRLAARARGGWFVFLTKGQDSNLSIVYTQSSDGKAWGSLQPLLVESGFNLNFLPSAEFLDNRDFVVFQSLASLPGSERSSFQLFIKYSDDGGSSWSEALLLTSFNDPVIKTRAEAFNFDNQRPVLFKFNNELWLAWERRQLVAGGTSQIYIMRLERDGSLKANSVERVSSGQGNCSDPRFFSIEGAPALTWVDDRRGSPSVIMAIREGVLWNETNLSIRTRQSALFGRTLYVRGGIYSFWQTATEPYRIIGLIPDTTVDKPQVRAVNFAAGTRTRESNPIVQWTVPPDSSGILGYSWSWSKNPGEQPPLELMELSTNTRKALEADSDGEWYFSIRAEDYAGNWSEPSVVRFVRDTIPPPAPVLNAPAVGADYFLSSNTFSVSWIPPQGDEVTGYTWVLQYLGPLDRPSARKRNAQSVAATAGSAAQDVQLAQDVQGSGVYPFEPFTDYEKKFTLTYDTTKPPPQRRTGDTRASFSNIDDGYYVFAVSAIDSVGNVSPPARMLVRADKFVPYTAVTNVLVQQEDFGEISATIIGRGFLEEGTITRVVIDLDGKEPWDKVFDTKDYSILSDTVIRNIKVNDMNPGLYKVGVLHSGRGWLFTGNVFRIDVTGTVKFGDYTTSWKPSWMPAEKVHSVIKLSYVIMAFVFLLALLGFAGTGFRLRTLLVERNSLLEEAKNIMQGKTTPVTIAGKKELKAKGGGLFVQFAFTIALLVLFVVILVTVPLGYQLLTSQSEALAQGLEQRSRVLLESIAQGSRSYLPAKNVLELTLLPGQKTAIKEANYITITAVDPENINNEIFWASNDPGIAQKAGTSNAEPGSSQYRDELSSKLVEVRDFVNSQAESRVGDLAKTIQDLSQEGRTLATKLDDPKNLQRFQELSAALRDIERNLNLRLNEIAEEAVTSDPVFNATALNPTALKDIPENYTFIKPIIFRQEKDQEYFRGFVRLSVSTKLIVQELADARSLLVRNSLIIAVIALVTGVVGALALARIIARPILRLAEGIEVIRSTQDKKRLENFVIDVKSKNEIGVLTDTINSMTESLVSAAKEADLLTVGKEVQKMFLPLETKPTGEKLSVLVKDEPSLDVFGYYEGAKGVSGDYFDFVKLEPPYYAFIKCDVAGKGVPAALIMVGVATIFSTEFAEWSVKKHGLNLPDITYKINEFIDSKGFKGRFAAFIMGIYDSSKGLLHLCHAGDRLVHFYKADEKKFTTIELPSSPTAGTFDNDTVKATAPFKIVSLPMAPGDILLLYTDGFEEAARARRRRDFTALTETITDPRSGKTHEEFLKEQLGEERIRDITEAIQKKAAYTLIRQDDPLGPDARFTFDFSTCKGTLQDLVIGLGAVEKVFRMISDPNAVDSDTVVVDSLVDKFLSEHFREYSKYCWDKQPYPDEHVTEYLLYGHMKEDEQYDDLTMLAIRRK